MYFIGVDLGTSAMKLIMMDETGKIWRSVSKEYPNSFPKPGWSEQEPADWYAACISGVRELVEGVDASLVRGLSIAGQMHGLVTLDEHDEVLRPAILWNDGRSGEEVSFLNGEIGRERLVSFTGNIAFAGFTAPKIIWMQKNEPELFSKIKKIMLPKDYLVYRLTGEFVTEPSDASGMLLFDVKNRQWSDDMIAICGIDREWLPQVHESYEVVGEIRGDAASDMGLPSGVKVIAGVGDNAAAAIGMGVTGEGACNISLGTSGTLFISRDRFSLDPGNALHSFAHADGSYHLMGCMLSAASCNKWWMDGIIGTDDYAAEQSGISDDRLGRNPVMFLPYLMGERSPHNDPDARAAFIGMSMDTCRPDMTQAVLEGVAFGVRDMLEAARAAGCDVRTSRICGGGAKSPLWQKIVADVCDLTLEIPECEEGPGMGAAMLSMVGCGVYSDLSEAAASIVRIRETISPDREIVKRYEGKYKTYIKLYPALSNM